MNGEQYKGGQFLPNTELPKMAKRARKLGSQKVEIAPYVWEVAPKGKRSIYARYNAYWTRLNNADGNFTVRLCPTLNPEYFTNDYLLEVQKAADAWNAGERWMTV